MNRLTILIFGILIVATSALAQSQEDSWDNLQRLRPGDKIQVVDQKLKSQEGTFLSFSQETITLKTSQGEVALQRPDVFRVSSQKGMSRGKHALIGLGVGAAAGAIWGATLTVEEFSRAGVLFGTTAGLGGIGAGVGAALPAGHSAIYQAERRRGPAVP